MEEYINFKNGIDNNKLKEIANEIKKRKDCYISNRNSIWNWYKCILRRIY